MSLADSEATTPSHPMTFRVGILLFAATLSEIIAILMPTWRSLQQGGYQEKRYDLILGEGDREIVVRVCVCSTNIPKYDAVVRIFSEGKDGENLLETIFSAQLVRALDAWLGTENQSNKWFNTNDELCYGVTAE